MLTSTITKYPTWIEVIEMKCFSKRRSRVINFFVCNVMLWHNMLVCLTLENVSTIASALLVMQRANCAPSQVGMLEFPIK